MKPTLDTENGNYNQLGQLLDAQGNVVPTDHLGHEIEPEPVEPEPVQLTLLDEDDLADLIEQVIDDSWDEGWTTSVCARDIMRKLVADNIVQVKS